MTPSQQAAVFVLGMGLAAFAYLQYARARFAEKQLRSSQDELGTALAEHKRLLHAVSHELRTPLARLRFALELIELADDDAGRRRRIIEAGRDVDELESLVRDLLRHQALEASPTEAVQRVTVTVAPLLKQIAADGERVRSSTEVHWTGPDDLGEVELDPKLFRRAIGNLVSNAARYAEDEVELSAERRDGRLFVYVDDDGPGVPPDQREAIFAPFQRLDEARSRDTGGSGLGLPIAIGVARAHGGSIEVEESPLGGARFIWESPA